MSFLYCNGQTRKLITDIFIETTIALVIATAIIYKPRLRCTSTSNAN